MKKRIIWLGFEYIGEETNNQILSDLREGTLVFEVPDEVMITLGKAVAENLILLREEY